MFAFIKCKVGKIKSNKNDWTNPNISPSSFDCIINLETSLPSISCTVYQLFVESNLQLELAVGSTDGVVIDIPTFLPIPKSMSFVHAVQLSTKPSTVYQYNGVTYVEQVDGKLSKVNSNYESSPFLTFPDYIECVRVYKDRVYTLVYGEPRELHVHDLSGLFVTKWDHNDDTD